MLRFTILALGFVCLASSIKVKCPPGIKRFAAEPNTRRYYECKRVGAYPVLKMCPKGMLYHASFARCRSEGHVRTRRSASYKLKSIIDEPTLGRHVGLGDLYNARTNKVWTGTSLWSQSTIKQYTRRSPSPRTSMDYTAGRTAYERMAKMDISAELKLSFMSGMIAVEGSAGYLRDSLESDEQVNVIMESFQTTHSMTLDGHSPGKDYVTWCQNKEATHIVASIKYGMGANMVFKRRVKKDESKDSVSGRLMVSIKKIPSLSIKGEASINLTSSEKAFVDKVDVTLYGDFILEEQPTTYDQAIKVYETIPSKMGPKPLYPEAAPVQMTLHPLSTYCNQADNILIGINEGILRDISTILDETEQMKIRMRGLLGKDASARFLQIRNNILLVEQELLQQVGDMQAQLQNLLPKIRGAKTGAQEGDLITLKADYVNSQIYTGNMMPFLDNREREIKIIDNLVDTFISTPSVLIMDFEQATGVIEILTSPYVVIANLNILLPSSIATSYIDGNAVDERNMWFNDRRVYGRIGYLLREFSKFAAENSKNKKISYLVRMNPTKTPHDNVQVMKDGKTVSEAFIIPHKPETPMERSVTHNTVSMQMPSRTDPIFNKHNGFITGVKVIGYAKGFKDKTFEQDFEYGASNNDITVTGLKANTEYYFTYKFITEMGLSPPSDASDSMTTLPTSPPVEGTTTSITSSAVTITWEEPAEIGSGVRIGQYFAQLFENTNVVDTKQTSSRSVSFTGLKAATNYVVCVKASVGHKNSLCMDVSFTSMPATPNTPSVSAVLLNSATIAWSAVASAPGSSLLHYEIYFSQYSGNNEKTNTAIERKVSPTKTTAVLGDLVMNTKYGVKVKAVSTKGESAYSSVRFFNTKFEQTELDKFKADLIAQLRQEYTADFQKSTAAAINTLRNADISLRSKAQDLSRKFDSLKVGQWPKGSYCIYQGETNCPAGFTAQRGFVKGIETNEDGRSNIRGAAFMMSSLGCYNFGCGFFKPYNAEIIFSMCCRY